MIRRLVAALLVAAAPGLAQAQIALIAPDTPLGDSSNRIVNTRSMLNTLLQGTPLGAGTIFIGNASNFAQSRVMSGDCSISITGILTCTQSAGNFKVNGALTVTGGATVAGTLTVNGAIVDTSGGLTLGSPLGGSKGSGTANASVGYYVNGVLLPTISPSVPLPLSMGGTGGSLIPSPGGIVYTDAFGMRVLPSPFPGKFLRSGFSAPNWTQTTWSDTYASGAVLVSSGPNNIQGLAAASSTQLLISQTNAAPSWNTMSGDCTISAAGAITCTKTGGVAFTALATTAVPVPIASGGTNATSATNARVNLATVGVVKTQIFTANGTYTPSTGMLYAIIECVGPGAGGGGATSSAGNIGSGGGGGAGGYSRIVVSAATIGASKAVVVGTGGAGGTAGNNNGSNGSAATTVGATICVANAGVGGGGAGGGSAALGGAGAGAGTGDLAIAGESGGYGLGAAVVTVFGLSGKGGSNPLGTGGAPVTTNGALAGQAGGNYGGGGSGASSDNAGGAAAGGAGASGVVFITEFTNQ